MTQKHYKIVFSGKVVQGQSIQAVKKNLAEILKMGPDTIERLFSGRRMLIKKDVDHQTAAAFVKAFKKAGALCEAVPLGPAGNTRTAPPVEPLPDKARLMTCPKCGYEQIQAQECMRCGIVIRKYLAKTASHTSDVPAPPPRTETVQVVFPRIGQAFLLVAVLFLLQVAAGILAGYLMGLTGRPVVPGDAVLIGLGNALSFAVILFWLVRKSGRHWKDIFLFEDYPRNALFPVVLFIVGLSIFASEADNVLQYFFPMPSSTAFLYQNLLQANVSSFITLAVIAPVTEELFFRGILLGAFLKNYGEKKGVLFSALLFMLFHINPYQFFISFTLGIFLAWLFIRTRSLIPCILAHALNNVVVLFAGTLLKVPIPGYTGEIRGAPAFQSLWFNLLGAVLIVAGIAWLLSMFGEKRTEGTSGAKRIIQAVGIGVLALIVLLEGFKQIGTFLKPPIVNIAPRSNLSASLTDQEYMKARRLQSKRFTSRGLTVQWNGLQEIHSVRLYAGCPDGEKIVRGEILARVNGTWQTVAPITDLACGDTVSFEPVTTDTIKFIVNKGGGKDKIVLLSEVVINGFQAD